MSMEDFRGLLSLVAPPVSKTNTNFREAIPPENQLAVTLRFLATGGSFSTLMYLHRISKSAICNIILRVCEAIVQVLSQEVKLPATEEEWLKIAKEYEEKWNFPRCLGAIDGRHIDTVAPPSSGTVYFNYKECFSIVLLAIAGANYRIIYADVGTQGRISDGGVLKGTSFYKMLETKNLNIAPSTPLPGRSKPVPYVFIADEAFGLEENIVKPFPRLHKKK
ncbi:uncharacterized protein LOC126106816 [Schistocerca cancellata]|uniref:uncharacterized protein LOC126106816 n=1 Tax=Schistocerca cancellata TaxID=274614 RepID=UPI0021178F9D|nr:uncharacterized protein LOC126106816 [Schistocerca cancellata]